MLKKVRNLRAIKPGQWARTTVPDFDCWKKSDGWRAALAGELVDICVMPIYKPRYDSDRYFHWSYHVAYRNPGSSWPNYSLPERSGWIAPWDFGLEESTKFFWVEEEWREHEKGKGAYLYEPASDDPALCPGPDCSLYLCDKCEKHVMPWSNDDGDLVCGYCDVPGLVIHDEKQLDRLEEVREFARKMGLSAQLEHQLSFLGSGRCWGNKSQCVLSWDFAPHSFSFAHYVLPDAAKDGKRNST